MSIKIKKDNMIYNDPNAIIDPNAPLMNAGGSNGKILSAVPTGGAGVITNPNNQVPAHLNAANNLINQTV